jgi:hypothetical protein
MWKKFLLLSVVGISALVNWGCLPLMIGGAVASVGYEGYKYEKTGNLPGVPPKSQVARTRHRRTQSAPQAIE